MKLWWRPNYADAGGSRGLSGCSDAPFKNPHHHWSVLHCGWGPSRGGGRHHQRPDGTRWYLAAGACVGRVGEIKNLRKIWYIGGVCCTFEPKYMTLLCSSFRWYRVETNYDHWLPPPARDHRKWVISHDECFHNILVVATINTLWCSVGLPHCNNNVSHMITTRF